MGILNVTPDSFSDGGLHFDTGRAVEAGARMAAEGADLLDVGGESTRPGAAAVGEEEEIRRVVPVIETLALRGLAVSIDTSKPEVARRALQAGAALVNDVTGFRNAQMRQVCGRAGCHVCIMHMRGDPRTMQENPVYEDVIAEVRDFLVRQARLVEEAGVPKERIWIDPGIGFGKTLDHNLTLLRGLERLVEAGYPVLVGVSRKSFLAKLLGAPGLPLPPDERLEGTLAAQVLSQAKGAKIIRAHDVKESRRAIEVAAAIL
jgi:dihydropteroate synthase